MKPHKLCIAAAIGLALAGSHSVHAQPKAPAPASSEGELRVGGLKPIKRTPGAIRLATYNIENLFDDKDDPALSGDFEDLDDAKPASQKEAVALAIKRIDADVIALQEIESYEALIEFRDQYLKDLGYEHVVSIDAGDSRGIENAVISRFPLSDAKVWVGMMLDGPGHPPDFGPDRKNPDFGTPFDFRRSPLRVTATVPSETTGGEPYELTLFVVHHKSGGGSYNYWRLAESKKVVELVGEFRKEKPRANIAVLGDFNCQPHQEPIAVYLGAELMDINMDHDSPGQEILTHASERTIDMILVTSTLMPEIVKESRFTLATPQLPVDADWRTAPKPKGYASDHVPVVVDIIPKDR